jgi:uncharacterized protein (DUF362 family)
MNEMSRRLFLKWITIVGSYFAGIFSFPFHLFGAPGKSSHDESNKKVPPPGTGVKKSRVVMVKNSAGFDSNRGINLQVVDEMLNNGMPKLTGESSPDSAWKRLFKPNDIVGIKVNALGGREIATHTEVVNAIVLGLTRVGIPEQNIIIWDRLTRELESSGYTINTSRKGVRCFGTDADYDPSPEMVGSIGSCFSSIVSSLCTALINIPVLKDHDLAGVSLSLKNFYGAIHNPNKYHDNRCDPYIADVNSHPYIKDKLRLVICDALTMQYQGGPAYKPQWALDYCGLLLSRDPVAIDRIGAKLIEDTRKEKGLPSLKEAGREPVHIASAAKRNLGISDLESIELVTG